MILFAQAHGAEELFKAGMPIQPVLHGNVLKRPILVGIHGDSLAQESRLTRLARHRIQVEVL